MARETVPVLSPEEVIRELRRRKYALAYPVRRMAAEIGCDRALLWQAIKGKTPSPVMCARLSPYLTAPVPQLPERGKRAKAIRARVAREALVQYGRLKLRRVQPQITLAYLRGIACPELFAPGAVLTPPAAPSLIPGSTTRRARPAAACGSSGYPCESLWLGLPPP
jgi:hypothetical protein